MKILDNLCRLYWGEQHKCTTSSTKKNTDIQHKSGW